MCLVVCLNVLVEGVGGVGYVWGVVFVVGKDFVVEYCGVVVFLGGLVVEYICVELVVVSFDYLVEIVFGCV